MTEALQEKLRVSLKSPYPVHDGVVFAVSSQAAGSFEEDMRGDIVNSIKKFLKRWGGFYEFLHTVFSPGVSPMPHLTQAKALRKAFPSGDIRGKLVVDIGSGVKRVPEGVVKLDIFPYPGVAITADTADLPFRDGSVDMILCEDVLEHVSDPARAISEMKRVLAPGGYLYVAAPFIYPFHASPNDFLRFSRNALRLQLAPLAIIEEGARSGPMSALQGLLMHSFAMLLSFGSYALYAVLCNIFMILFSPLKLLDLAFGFFPYVHESSADLYVLARKE